MPDATFWGRVRLALMLAWDKWALWLGFGAASVLLLALYLWVYDREPAVFDGYEVATVIFTNTMTTDTRGFSLVVHFRLGDGTTGQRVTRSLEKASGITDTVCLARSVSRSGALQYRVAYRHLCAP